MEERHFSVGKKKMIKAKITKLVFIGAGFSILASCATTKAVEDTEPAAIIEEEIPAVEKIRKEPKQIQCNPCRLQHRLPLQRICKQYLSDLREHF